LGSWRLFEPRKLLPPGSLHLAPSMALGIKSGMTMSDFVI
jgi:hypothetical protein